MLIQRYAVRITTQIRSRIAAHAERGASLVEYGLLLVFVLLVAFASIQIFGETVVDTFDAGGEAFEAGATTSAN